MSAQSKLTLAAALGRLADVGETLERELRDNQPLLRDIKYLLSALSDGRTEAVTNQPKWISVKERLPGSGKTVLCCFGSKLSAVTTGLYDARFNIWRLDAFLRRPITHWMLMPEPPKED